ncbi:natural product biosynthesis luciferase-like monooxygenase protein [Kitasatospora sp. GP30]|uniref:MupA/Atu3671 family FMN-dependent luciferase-like monooxygenase n=1 Tax=Kitasatospora sp. GP30 TaxID=3035084 RepID=UPI000C70307B|nr:MupA/Atu3671 family FMN-dependent luciferase-like monooxygenase [Kitasatospora sp. GP30]MDH6138473.1 natural product biosynthesis luciferase-like monooxygenase protein [Kitasatospora sp. GP30]
MRFSLMFFAADDGAAQDDLYALFLDAVRLADEGGLTAVWIPERHFARFGGPYPNPALLGAAAATVTKRLKIRAGSVILPLQDPLRVAEEWSVVDNLSRGRAEVSFGSGWNVNDFVLAPDAFERRRESMWEQIDAVQRLWRGECLPRRNGAGRVHDTAVFPRPVQPELPVWLTAQSPDTFATAGAAGYPVLTNLNFNSPESLTTNAHAYRQLVRSSPDRHRAQLALMLHTFVADTDGEARTATADPLRRYLRANLELRAQFAVGKGSGGPPLSASAVDAIVERGVDRILDWAGLIGGPIALHKKVAYFAEQGVDELACLVDFGTDHDATLKSVGRLCELAQQTSGR